MKSTWFPGKLIPLNEAECRELLASHDVGRVAWNDALGPVIVPVNYSVGADGDIRFRTEPGSALAMRHDLDALTFQIDEADRFLAAGWSVLVRGTVQHVMTPANDLNDDADPWAGGDRSFHVRLTPRVISGRRIIPS